MTLLPRPPSMLHTYVYALFHCERVRAFVCALSSSHCSRAMYACIGNYLCNGNGRPRRRRRACGGKASPTPSVKLPVVSCTRLRSLYLSVTLSLSPTRARAHTHTRTKTYSVRKTIRRAWRPPTGASSNKCSKNKVTANSTTSMPAIPGLDARRRPGGHKKMNAWPTQQALCVTFFSLSLFLGVSRQGVVLTDLQSLGDCQ